MARWKFTEVNTTTTYEFEINPSEASSIERRRNLSYQTTTGQGGAVLHFEGARQPGSMTASGTILTQAQHTALDTWAQKDALVDVVDDLGRDRRCIINAYTPQRRRSSSHPWRHDYTLDFTVIRENN